MNILGIPPLDKDATVCLYTREGGLDAVAIGPFLVTASEQHCVETSSVTGVIGETHLVMEERD